MTLRQSLQATAALCVPAALGLIAAFGITASAAAQTTPSAQDFVNAAGDTANWILPHKSYSANNYTPATQINPTNVRNLHLAWKLTVDDTGPMEVSPIIYNGTMYITTAHDHVYALNAATGKVLWSFTDNPHVISFAANRGIGLFDGNVYIGTLDGHFIALNAKTGQKVWDKVTVDDTANSFYTMSPVPYHDPETNQDMIFLGVSDGDWGGNGNMTAYNPQNGDVIWRWDTVPGPGQPGHDTWSGDSWKRGGAAAWGGVTIDTATHTMYLDLGNPSPDFLGSVRKGANLYTDTMVALDISGAKPTLKWYHQFIPHDTHDWDPAMQPVLFTGEVDGKPRKLVAAGDKAGNFWILDAETGKLIDHTAVSFQKGHETQPTLTGNVACPNTLGGVEYQGGAYDPATNIFYVPSQNECGFWKADKEAVYIAGEFFIGGAFPTLIGPDTGQMNAVDVSNGIFAWRHHFNLPNYGGALVTASGLVFSGNLGGNENAFDAKTGNILWSYDTGGYIQAPTEAYEVDGKEYIVVASGEAGNAKIPELPTDPPRPNTINVFTVN
ncbi:MAG TPA: PQQ-binding-like beta-propeller repeat protein [Acetobacteraceae bacterium]|nr:PQQ-binding-like beta-propeller repeat protein [Acetobacteraceae bacterium]